MTEKRDARASVAGTDPQTTSTDPGRRVTRVCGACGATSTDRFCSRCGFELVASQAAPQRFPPLGTDLVVPFGELTLGQALAAPPGARRYLASDARGVRYEVFAIEADGDRTLIDARAEGRQALGELAPPQVAAFEAAGVRYDITQLPDAQSLAEGLGALLGDRRVADPQAAVERWVLPVVETLARLHAEGRFFGMLDPFEVLVSADGQCCFRECPVLFDLSDVPVKPGPRRAISGFAAPEVFGHCTGQLLPTADVFFVGAVLYYVMTRIQPLAEAGQPGDRLPPPQIYAPDLPPELAAVARRATSPLPARRYADAGALLDALRWALSMNQTRRAARWNRLSLDVGHELHIGVLKGQYAPVNQDDIFLAFDGHTGTGMFIISDGVSISEFGSGDQASACVRAEALTAWRVLQDGGVGNSHGHTTLPTLRADRVPDAEARRRVLGEILDAANRRIAELIHEEMPRFPGPAEGIMAATAVGILCEGNHATLFSIGDSRLYLIRDGHTSSLMVDDDLSTQLMRLGRAPSAARVAPAGGALIRCVGEFEKSDDDRLIPVPLQPGFRELTILPGDKLVMCSDGIPDYAGLDEEDAEENMRRVVETAPGSPWAAFELMVLANRGGGGDNISCIVLNWGPPTVGFAETLPDSSESNE